jgi:hypothetical protein
MTEKDIKKIVSRMNTKISDFELENFINTNINFINLDTSRISKYLIAQLYVFHDYMNFDISDIVRQIRYLEGINTTSSTKEATQFTKKPLKGLWHKHFFDAQYILLNIGSEFGLNRNGNPKLDTLLSNFDFTKFDMKMNKDIINEIIRLGFSERVKNRKLTGEWIIFAKHESHNYYLTIARHTEKDIDIYKRLKKNIDNFSCFHPLLRWNKK